MALQHLRSSTANKRPVPSGMADGQLAINSNLASPGLFLKDSNGDLVKVGPVHIGTTAPNVSPASGGQAGNSKGEQWLDTASSRYVFKVWDGTAWRTQDGEFVNVTGDTMTGALVMDNQQQVQFRETTANGTNYIALQATASVASDKIITLPDITGTVVTTGDTGSITSTMILDGTIVNADVNASAAIVDTKLATIATAGKVSNSATTATSSGTVSTIVARDGSGNFTAGTITATLAGNASTVTTNANLTGDITSSGNATSIATGAIVNDDVNASAAIAGSKISPNFGSQTVQTTGIFSAAAGTAGAPSLAFTGDTDTGFYSPGVNQAAISTAGTGKLFVDGNGNVAIAQAPSNIASFTKSFNITAANASIALRATSTGLYTDQGIFFAVDTVNYAQIHNDNVGQLIFRTGSSLNERLRIMSTGLVGIGTSAPASLLHVKGSASGTNIRVEGGASTDYTFLQAANPSGAEVQLAANGTDGGRLLTASNHPLDFFTNGTRAVRIDTLQRVGIGTTSPGSALEINAATATSPFIAKINTAEAARIDSSGRLLVGTSSDSGGALLQVNGDRIRVGTAKTPATSGATGAAGEIAWDANYIYVCTATNTWKRVAIATW